jgi:hypothetical protein
MMQFRFYLINQYIDSHLPHLIFGELGYTEIWYNQPHKRVRPHAGKGKMTVADIGDVYMFAEGDSPAWTKIAAGPTPEG